MKPFILACDYREALQAARRLELGAGQWRYLGMESDLWGTRGATVYRTPRWPFGRSVDDWCRMLDCLKYCQADMVDVWP